jgi:hypothetical protein
MDVLPTFAVYNTSKIDESGLEAAKRALETRLLHLYTDDPIPFRRQNEGDYPDKHTLAPHVAPGIIGIPAHVATNLTGDSTANSTIERIDQRGLAPNPPHIERATQPVDLAGSMAK